MKMLGQVRHDSTRLLRDIVVEATNAAECEAAIREQMEPDEKLLFVRTNLR